jgi:hypothetical protein
MSTGQGQKRKHCENAQRLKRDEKLRKRQERKAVPTTDTKPGKLGAQLAEDERR